MFHHASEGCTGERLLQSQGCVDKCCYLLLPGTIAVVNIFYFGPLNADNLMTEVFTGVWVDPHYVAISRSGPLVGSKSTCLHCCPFTPSKAKLGRAGSAAGNVGDV